MDLKINQLIDSTKAKYGLDNYYLKRHSLSRRLNFLNETVYFLAMEWLPNHVTEQEDDDLNPEGKVIVDLDINHLKYESVIFVGDISFANGVKFDEVNINTIINWIEMETGLAYEKQFQLDKENNRDYRFISCVDGTNVSPSGYIQMNIDQSGNLTNYTKHGHFPSQEMITQEAYTLSLDTIGHLAWEQLKLVEFPSFESEQISPAYCMEEIYITNNLNSLIPFDFTRDMRSIAVNKLIHWVEPNPQPFERNEVHFNEDTTIEQALLHEPSPDSFPITETEQERCIASVISFMRQKYANESGQWILKTLHRDNGYIHASLRLNQEDNRIFQRKLTIIIDTESLKAINFVDNQPMIDQFSQFSSPEEVIVNKKEAYEKIKGYFELTPCYVYNSQQNKYVLCGMLDCHYGVRASNGDIMMLDDL